MAETYEGAVETLDDKSIRYPGHLAGMHLLLEALRFKDTPGELVQRMRLALPPDEEDWVLVHASAQGHKHGTLQTQALVMEYRPITIGHQIRTAIAWTTAASLVAVVELVARAPAAAGFCQTGSHPAAGVPQDDHRPPFCDAPSRPPGALRRHTMI